MHRLVCRLLGILLILPVAGASVVAAQEATPESPFAGLGLPELNITVSQAGYEGIPEQIEAGRYLVTLTVSEDTGEFGGGVGFIQPAGMTADEFVGMFAAPPDTNEGEAAATPPVADAADAAASPAAGGEGGVPPVLFESAFAGGIYAGPGQSAQIVLDLTPGEWVAWGDDPAAPWPPVVFEATGEMPADLPEPDAGASLTMGEYLIEVSEGELVSGPQVIRVDNIGAQPHFITAGTTTVDVTEADIEAVLEADLTGTPAAVDFNPDEDFQEAFFSGTQSTGTSVWLPVDLQPGTLVMLCFFPDLGDGLPHAYHGMYELVEIPE